MNILCISDAFWPDQTGGISKSLLNEVNALKDRGNKITVISRQLNSQNVLHETKPEYEHFRYRSPSMGSIFYRLYPFVSVYLLPNLLKKILTERNIDVVYVHNVFQAYACLRANIKIPIVYVFHASAYREVAIDSKRGKYGFLKPIADLQNLWIKKIEENVLSNVDKIIVRSDFMKEDLFQLYGNSLSKKQVIILPLGVDTDRFSLSMDVGQVRDVLGLPKDKAIFFTVRRLVARMGLENLIAAMKGVVKQYPDTLLLVGGKGYLQNELTALVSEFGLQNNIIFLGFISEDKLPQYYQAADLFVLPTAELEGFGLVTIESLACGTPVIATPVGANKEVAGGLGTEYLFKDNTSDAICQGLLRWLDRGSGEIVREQCRSHCNTKYSIQFVAQQLDQLLSDATN